MRDDEAAVGGGEDVDLDARAEPPAQGEVAGPERRLGADASAAMCHLSRIGPRGPSTATGAAEAATAVMQAVAPARRAAGARSRVSKTSVSCGREADASPASPAAMRRGGAVLEHPHMRRRRSSPRRGSRGPWARSGRSRPGNPAAAKRRCSGRSPRVTPPGGAPSAGQRHAAGADAAVGGLAADQVDRRRADEAGDEQAVGPLVEVVRRCRSARSGPCSCR